MRVRCRHVLHHPQPAATPDEPLAALILRLTGLDILHCPICRRGRMVITQVLPPSLATVHPPDTS
jgi:hypothetical protein